MRTIKCDGNKSHSRAHAEHLIDDGAGRIDPTRETKVAESWKDEVWKPVPAEGDAAGDGKKCVARDLPRIVAMTRV